MKVKDKYEYDYAAINLKRHVVKRFRKLSKKFAKPQSETLDAMVDFFEWHGFSPFDKKEPSLLVELLKNRKRTEAVIAIIKDIEKHHDKPTTAMLQLLFEQTPPKEKQPRLVAINPKDRPFKEDSFATSLEAIELRKQKNMLQHDLDATKKQFEEVIFSRINVIKPSFGKPKIQLDMSIDAFEALKEQIKNR